MLNSLTVGGNTVVTTRLPGAGFSITIRIALTADASSIDRLTTCVGEAGAIVTALDVVDSDTSHVLVDLTCDTADSSHADQVVKTLEELHGVDVRKVSDGTFLLHLGGKIEASRRWRRATGTSCPGPLRPWLPGSALTLRARSWPMALELTGRAAIQLARCLSSFHRASVIIDSMDV